eukprot:3027643-Alexandrium_andersonii.AAC.1
MSASLVGSEMCIRDSALTAAVGYEALVRERFRPALLRSVPGADGGTRPVSYTHLTLPTICSV